MNVSFFVITEKTGIFSPIFNFTTIFYLRKETNGKLRIFSHMYKSYDDLHRKILVQF